MIDRTALNQNQPPPRTKKPYHLNLSRIIQVKKNEEKKLLAKDCLTNLRSLLLLFFYFLSHSAIFSGG